MPAITSTTKWLAVATTASDHGRGPERRRARAAASCRVARKTTIPSRTFQPAWKLGIAAYWLTSAGGTICR